MTNKLYYVALYNMPFDKWVDGQNVHATGYAVYNSETGDYSLEWEDDPYEDWRDMVQATELDDGTIIIDETGEEVSWRL